MGNSRDRRKEHRLAERVAAILGSLLPQKPIDAWLQLAGTAVGLILFLLPKTPIVVVGALFLIFACFVHPLWNFWWIEKKILRRIGSLVVLAVALSGLGFLAWPSVPPTPTPIPHTLIVRYVSDRLPITVEPSGVIYILQLNPNIQNWALEIPNLEIKSRRWPDDIKIIQGDPPGDLIYRCDLTNPEIAPLIDAQISFDVSFHEPEMIAVTTKRSGKSGSTSFPSPGPDHIIVSLGHPRNPENLKMARDGKIIKAFQHAISIPQIKPQQTIHIYLINQSSLISKFSLPKKATAILPGNPQRVQVELIRPSVGIADVIPWFGLAPSTYHWQGVPGSP